MNLPSIDALLRDSAAQIGQALNLPLREARLEARLLLEHLLQHPHAWLIAHGDETLTAPQQLQLAALLQRRLNGEPIAYILGQREFYGLTFKVTTDTLIPRPDTELLVDLALAHLPANSPCCLLDMGTGTGAIAVTLAHLRPQASIIATDRSEAALAVARDNAAQHAPGRINFLASDWFSALAGQHFDLIVSNPPYIINTDPHLQQGDLRFEPASALASGTDGLDDLRQIISQAPTHLNPGGWLLVEHGYDQQPACQLLFLQAGFSQITTHCDLGGQPRVTLGRKSER